MNYFKNENGDVFAYDNDQVNAGIVPADFIIMTAAEINNHLNPPVSAEQIIAQYTAAIQTRLDDFARTRGYDGILSACTYATSAVAKFAAEGQYCVDARDSTWDSCYGILDAVESGSRPMPTIDEIIAELPVLEWPA